MSTDADVGQRVHVLMWERRITNRAMAGVLGVDESTLARKLRGKRKWTVDDLLAVSAELGVPVSELLPKQRTPAQVGEDPSVAGAGFEPATSGLRAHACRWCQAHHCGADCWCDCHWRYQMGLVA